ncbi:lysozyme [Rhizobium ruizarguesonis]|uniref:lysozyme n=1 Tax=Rhizobium ruizarguesonis TaxID=2081791 RepID=UPI0010326621|nr:lysozyme [Rhizobium ruizarguesonis]TBA72894.1 hypothetical protein ELH56_35115 [Rhizobium ruizarguesonis]WSH62374.1 lysozyme [Rhizobium ruizarguesonis]
MKMSLRGICSMLAEEAIVLSAYDDGTGTQTIGAGHTAVAGDPNPRSGMKISLTEAINIYRSDMTKVERQVAGAVHVSLSQNQFDALVSWHFSTGAISSATLTEKLNAGDIDGAAAEFARWNKSIFFPQLAPIVRVAEPLLNAATGIVGAAASSAQADTPIRYLQHLPGGGALGKLEKWVRALRNAVVT